MEENLRCHLLPPHYPLLHSIVSLPLPPLSPFHSIMSLPPSLHLVVFLPHPLPLYHLAIYLPASSPLIQSKEKRCLAAVDCSVVLLFVHAKYLFMTWVVAAAVATAYMAKFWQNLSRDRNISLSVLSVEKVSVEWLAGKKMKLVGTFPPKKRGWTGFVEKDTAGSSSDGAENTIAVAAGIALISIAAASSILLQVGKNAP
ncbi:hypothetical protein EZV62_013190 [Acer yangbiense]|uniref:Uncharacterized protein n=1 Tax=Acer yangbiense TaxID=1000413 RepID=A0A5C7HXI7_9ROSI|nr:hypothetical protein EZV62_013190 [Acer yangbiense]